MAFLPSLVKVDPKITQLDIDRALRLKVAICRRYRLERPCSIKAWARHLSLMRTVDKIDDDEITKTLDWFTRHLAERFAPIVKSTSSFREKYISVLSFMERESSSVVDKPPSPEAIAIAADLDDMHWPKGSQSQLPCAIQICLDNYREFLAKENDVPERLKIVFDTIKFHYGGSPRSFAPHWMRKVNAHVRNWAAWSGNLKSMAFRHDSKRFINEGRGFATECCGKSDRFDKLMESLYK